MKPQTIRVPIDPNDMGATVKNLVLLDKLKQVSPLLEAVPALTFHHVQNQRGWEKAALYLVLRDNPRGECVANFTAWTSGRTKLELRYKGYLDDAVWQELKVQRGSCRYFDLACWPLLEVIRHARTYACRIAPDVASGKIRSGSAGEREVHRLLKQLLGPDAIQKNTYPPEPPELRQQIGRKSHFDFVVQEFGKAVVLIEVDGAGHRQPIAKWGGQKALEKRLAADSAKDAACVRLGIGLVRINAHGRDAKLWALPEAKFCTLLRDALDRASTGELVPIG